MSPSWDHFRSFLAVLTEGSLSAAARKLRLSQPTIGRHIGELEADLGAALFTRSPSGLEPTETAKALRPDAEAMAAAADALVRAATGEASEARGTVRLTASEIVSIEILPQILAEFREKHPRITVELVVSNRTEDLLRRDSDIAIRMVPPVQAALLQRRIGVIELGLHARADYLERHGTPARPEDLHGHSVVGVDRAVAIAEMMQRRGLLPANLAFALRTDNDLAHLAAIRAGFGIGVCQVGLARRTPGIVRILPESFSFPLETWLAMHEDLRRVHRMRLLFDHLADGLGDYIAGQHAPG